MPILHFLATPEFEPLVYAAERAGMDVRTEGDYVIAESATPEVTLLRRDAPVRDAIWYAGLTAGMNGRIIRFDNDQLQVADI